MRALVAGATGFIGRHIVARLVADGHDVHVVVRPTSDQTAIAALRSRIAVHVVADPGEPFDAVMRTAAPDVVFNAAGLIVAEHGPADIARLVDSNILFPCQLVDAMVRNDVCRLVNCSTIGQHYENSAYSPISLYAATKQAFIDVLQFYTETTPLRVVDLALANTYGPHNRGGRLFSLLYQAADGETAVPFSPGRQLVDLVHIDDVVAAFLAAADRLREMPDGARERYAVRSGQPMALRELVAAFAEVTGLAPKIAWGARPYRRREPMVPWTCGADLPGWRPRIDIREGIRRLHDGRGRESAAR